MFRDVVNPTSLVNWWWSVSSWHDICGWLRINYCIKWPNRDFRIHNVDHRPYIVLTGSVRTKAKLLVADCFVYFILGQLIFLTRIVLIATFTQQNCNGKIVQATFTRKNCNSKMAELLKSVVVDCQQVRPGERLSLNTFLKLTMYTTTLSRALKPWKFKSNLALRP